MKPVAVVILNWNGSSLLRQFLPGVLRHSSHLADVVVIDNASEDDSLQVLAELFAEVRVIGLDRNYGFAGGYNMGLQKVPNSTIVLLNSDVEVTANWLEPVLAFMDSDPLMVACQPKILNFHERHQFEYAGAAGGFIDRDAFAFCAGRIFNVFEDDHGQYADNQEVFWASGAALFIRRQVYVDTGGLDADFYAHMEEIDLCWRLKNRGYKVGACRQSAVYHMGGGTLDRMNPFKTYLNFRNNLYLLVKNHHTSPLLIKLLKRMTLDGIAAMHFLSEGKWSYFKSVLRAHFSFYRHISLVARKRRSEKLRVRNPNLHGQYRRSIVFDFFLRGRKRFGQLPGTAFR